ncbi:MAG: S41 family peptidase [Gammaproteobacteria bacterium]|nr:S41 family peptidase [Gammaproteobacteria bacterium]
MKSKMRSLLVLTTGLILGVTLAIGQGVIADKDSAPKGVLPLDELSAFTEVFASIKKDYVEEVSDKTLLENAIRGMLSGLDPHSSYLDEDSYKELREGTTGEFGGLGIEVGLSEDGFVRVITPIDDTPAQRAGVKAGDLVIRLDEKPVKGLTLHQAVKIMRGKVGEEIVLTILREGEQKPLKITIKRDIIKVKSVRQRDLGDGFGYVRISQFQSRTGENLTDAIKKLTDENGGKLKGLVLDLRNNPGGVLNAAVDVSDAFIDDGLIVYTEGRIANSRMKFSATPQRLIDGAPLVVLVNGGSASASEIVAGALQDHKRALILGTRTFGKGSVQTILPLNRKSALKLTTARYFTPSGRSIQAEGIVPDIEIKPAKVTHLDNGGFKRIKEADLSRHLENHKGNGGDKKKAGDKEKEEEKQPLVETDYQLFEALNLLKGLTILQQEH